MADHPQFQCDVAESPTSAIVRASGELDMASAPRLEITLRSLAQTKHHITLDLRDVTFVDSTGIHVIFRTTELASTDRFVFTLIKGPPNVQRVLELCGLDAYLGYDSLVDDVSEPTDLAPYRRARDSNSSELARDYKDASG